MSDIDNYFKEQQERDRLRFGFENTLLQILWDAQVEEESMNECIHNLHTLISLTHTDEEMKRQFLEFNLDEYPLDEEE